MTNTKKETLQMQSDRSATLRANIKRYYIYVVLALIVFAFSVMKLDQVTFFGRGHFLSPDSVINIFRSAVPILTVSGAFTLLMISGYIDLSVGSAMSLNAVVFSWMILNGFRLPARVHHHLDPGVCAGIYQRLPGHEAAHYTCDRNPRDVELIQGCRAADRSRRLVGDQRERR